MKRLFPLRYLVRAVRHNGRGPEHWDSAPGAGRRYSVVIAAFNVGSYIDRCLQSLTCQSLSFSQHIEVIVIDDGSTDDTGARARRWQRKFPKNIFYIQKINGGPASARNLGLNLAKGDWVTFIDADDFVGTRYFASVDEFLTTTADDPCLVCGNVRYYYERSGRIVDSHPLRYRFQQGPVVVDAFRSPKFIHLAAAQAFYRRDLIESNRLRFSERVVPIFEDAHFTAKYLCLATTKRIAYLPDAPFYYTRRKEPSSLVNTSWKKLERYYDLLVNGYLDILTGAKQQYGLVPQYLQNLVLYDLTWIFRRLVDHDDLLEFIGNERIARFVAHLRTILEFIDIETVICFDLVPLSDIYRFGIVDVFKGQTATERFITLENYDLYSGRLALSYCYVEEPDALFLVDGIDTRPDSAKTVTHTFAGQLFTYQRIVTLLFRGRENLQITLNGQPVPIRIGKSWYKQVTATQIIIEFKTAERPSSAIKPPIWVPALRIAATRSRVRRKYHNAWLLMDRDVQADDNAEHFCRHLLRAHPDVEAYFVLRRTSHDWKRLEKEGFHLIAFGSLQHKLALLNCRLLISSHIDGYVVGFLPRIWFGDLLKYKVVFLQHGVTHNDISAWINAKRLDCMITAGSAERLAIVADKSRYRFSQREVVLTGFPRYDALFGLPANTQKTLVFMPTWRQYFTGDVRGRTNERRYREGFENTTYATAWRQLLSSERLAGMARAHGYQLVFFPHANVEQYIPAFRLGPHIKSLTHRQARFQEILSRATVVVTDYSSVAFDAAFMLRSVVYFQFDKEEFFAGEHVCSKGFFDYVRDGFGPCCHTEAELLHELETILKNGGVPEPKYVERMELFFPHRDNKNSERVFDAILPLLETSP